MLQALTNSVIARMDDKVRIFFISCPRLAIGIATTLSHDPFISYNDFPTATIDIKGSENFKVLGSFNKGACTIGSYRAGEVGTGYV